MKYRNLFKCLYVVKTFQCDKWREKKKKILKLSNGKKNGIFKRSIKLKKKTIKNSFY